MPWLLLQGVYLLLGGPGLLLSQNPVTSLLTSGTWLCLAVLIWAVRRRGR